MCLRGVSSLQKQWLDEQRGSDIAVFVVWSDQLGAQPRYVADAARLMPDSRARQYWDGQEVIGRAYQTLAMDGRTFTLDAPAWDVWMLFDRDAAWRSTPPKPAWWEHQLYALPHERQLNPERFAAKAQTLRAPAEPKRPPKSGTDSPKP